MVKLKSVGIIMDGNRRFAKRNLKLPEQGHQAGISKGREFLEWAKEAGVKRVTAYALSLENMKNRSKSELDNLFKYFEKEMDELLKKDHEIHENQTCIKFIGRLELLPLRLQNKIKKVMELTKNYSKYFFNLAIAYGGRQEIVDTCKKLAKKVLNKEIDVEEINCEVFSENAYLSKEEYPDLIIRTGNVQRISNFLLWASAYSELAFTRKMWPDLQKEDFLAIIDDYRGSERRFGK